MALLMGGERQRTRRSPRKCNIPFRGGEIILGKKIGNKKFKGRLTIRMQIKKRFETTLKGILGRM